MKWLSRRFWGETWELLQRSRRFGVVDLLILVGLAGLLYGIIDSARDWTGEARAAVQIDLSPWALPRYTFHSLMRGLLAYGISLAFTLAYGYWAAKDRIAERVLVPLLDILQSIPVLGFMPGLILALVAVFPHSNVGLELAAVLMIFTGQAWNMTFSFYHSVSTVPADLREVATVYRFSAWQRFRWTELPFSIMGLVWNSMMSMAGGWFFLMVCEAFQLGSTDFRLPGVGSYMSVAVEQGRTDAMLWAIAAMVFMIVAIDQLLWRPVVVWAQKYRAEEGGQQEQMTSWFLSWLRRSGMLAAVSDGLARVRLARERPLRHASPPAHAASGAWGRWVPYFSLAMFAVLLAVLGAAAWKLLGLLLLVPWAAWGNILLASLATLTRVLASTALATLWTVPAGLAIGLSPRLSRALQPVVQILASFPAPMLYPLVIALLMWAGVSLDFGSILLMLLGTQWYILFNVIAGAMAVPADLREAAQSFRIGGWQRFTTLYFPAIFPYLVTGWVTAAGGAWNASIVAEFVKFRGQDLQARGLGAQINLAAAHEDFPLLAASILVMSAVVVIFNRTVWRSCYRLAETRFSLTK